MNNQRLDQILIDVNRQSTPFYKIIIFKKQDDVDCRMMVIKWTEFELDLWIDPLGNQSEIIMYSIKMWLHSTNQLNIWFE